MPPLTIENVILHLRDFIVIWISQILYYNRIYAVNTFERKSYLDTIAYQSRVPQLNEFLKSFANEMVTVLISKEGGGKVHEVLVLIYNESNLHVEKRYVANFSQFVGLGEQISNLEFLTTGKATTSAKLNISDMNWNNIYTHFRSLIFFHIEELKRTLEKDDNNLFFKLLLNIDGSVDLSSEQAKWVKLSSEVNTKKTKLVSLGEMSVGFLCLDLHNEYVN